MIRASYRSAGDTGWIGVIRDGGTVLVECGHTHDNRDVTTRAGGTAATICARTILAGAQRPTAAEYTADQLRTAWTRLNPGTGFTMPKTITARAEQICAEQAAAYLARVDIVRAALADQPTPAPRTAAAGPTPGPVGDIPDWMC